jgi:hypothetical protein
MPFNPTHHRVLDPFERFSEIVFGLIMVLSFTCALSIAEVGREDVHGMLVGAIGCNLAWGIIDAAFYLINCLAERARDTTILRKVKHAATAEAAHQMIADALPPIVVGALSTAELEQIRAHIAQWPERADRARLTMENWRGALGVFLLVFGSTLPVVLPFVFLHDAHLALRISNGIAVAMLFGAGHLLGGHAGLRRVQTGLAMVAIGIGLVALTIALGG